MAVLVSCFTSGFGGVYFEKLMKAKPNSLWLRNIEMSLVSVLIAIIAAGSKDLALIRKFGFFHGYRYVSSNTLHIAQLTVQRIMYINAYINYFLYVIYNVQPAGVRRHPSASLRWHPC